MPTTHRQRRKSIDAPGEAHHLTFSCYRKLPPLESDETKLLFLECLDNARARCGFDLWAFVVINDHVHLVVHPKQNATRVSEILWHIKQPFSRRLPHNFRRNANAARMLRVGNGFRVWQAGGGYDRNLVEAREIWNAIKYLHQNPVRKGFVADATKWRWSSALFYEGIGEADITVDACEVFL